MKDLQKTIGESQNMLNMLVLLLENNPQSNALLTTIKGMLANFKTSYASFQFIYVILEILISKSQSQKPLSDVKSNNNSQMITE